MVLKSKFRKLFVAKYLFFTPICLCSSIYSVVNYFDESEKLKERYGVLLLGLFLMGLMISLGRELFDTYRVVLDTEKISIEYIVTGKKEVFFYKDIDKVDSRHHRMYRVKGFPLNDGYHSLIYRSNDGRAVELSPAVFANYGALVNAVRENSAS